MIAKHKWTRHAIQRFRQRFRKMNRFEVFAESERVTAKVYKKYTGRTIPSYFTRINWKVGAIFIIEVSPITKRRMIVTVFSTIRRYPPAVRSDEKPNGQGIHNDSESAKRQTGKHD